MKKGLFAALLLFVTAAVLGAPQQLVLKNQYGEVSKNYNIGSYFPFPAGVGGVQTGALMAMGTISPTAATLVGVAGPGSLYLNYDPAQSGSANLWINFGTITAPSWAVIKR